MSNMSTAAVKPARKLSIKFQDHVTRKKTFKEQYFTWATVNEVKQKLQHRLKVHHSSLQLKYKTIQLTNGSLLSDYDIRQNPVFTVKLIPKLEGSLGVANPYRLFEIVPPQVEQLMDEVQSGFLNGARPHLAVTGTSGTYFLVNHKRKKAAIFKPYDEQPFAPNNPRKFVGELGGPGFRRGILSGQGATREVAAYMLDNNGFHGVPATTYIEFYHPSFEERSSEAHPINSQKVYKTSTNKTKHGSLQCFADHSDMLGDYSKNVYSTEEIRKIAILDIRILNCDRNEENVLVKKWQSMVETSTGVKCKKEYKLIPIDHGLSFPDNFAIYTTELVWMNFSQIQGPLSTEELLFIDGIDPEGDCQLLREKLGFRQICLRNFRIAETFLKAAAQKGFSLQDIGLMLYRRAPESSQDSGQEVLREKDGELSEIEKFVEEIEDLYFLIKKNGIKSTIEYRIGLLKTCDGFFPKMDQKTTQMECIEEEEFGHQNFFSCKNQPSVKRSISLPVLRDKEQEVKTPPVKGKGKRKPKNPMRTDRELRVLQEQWDEVFFYYFKDRLKFFLDERLHRTVKRNRIKTEECD